MGPAASRDGRRVHFAAHKPATVLLKNFHGSGLKTFVPVHNSASGGAGAQAAGAWLNPIERSLSCIDLCLRATYSPNSIVCRREVQQTFELSPSIRGLGRGGFPALNIGGTPQSVEIYAFAPGLDPAKLDVTLDRGVLTISGERLPDLPNGKDDKATVHVNERFDGRFRRVVSLADDLDPNGVSAESRDGVVHISIKRRESAQPRRINVQ